MWSDASRAAAAEARKKSSGHNAGKGNRPVAKHIKDQHTQPDKHAVLKGAAKGALIGSVVPGIGTVAGAAIGAYRAKAKAK